MLLVDTDEDDKKVEEDDGNNDDIYIFFPYTFILFYMSYSQYLYHTCIFRLSKETDCYLFPLLVYV